MKKVTLITVCIFAFTCNNSFSQQSKRTLAVPFHGQGYTYWCWAASAAMVLDYEFGQNNYVCTVVSNYLAIGGIYIDCCQFPALCNGGVSSTDIYNYLNRHTNYSFIKENRALEFDEIKDQIDNGHPLIVLLRGNSGYIGHAITIVGYNEANNNVRVFDPAAGKSWLKYEKVLKYAGLKWKSTIYHD